MVRLRFLLAVLLCCLWAPVAAHSQTAQRVSHTPVPLSWVPQGFESLGQRAAFHTDFTFDRSMLQLAGYFIGDADQQTRNAIAKLDGISVHSYHFAAPGLYDPAALDHLRRQYEALGWKHLVAAHGRGDPFQPSQTDLWINFAHMDVTGMMILVSGSKDLNLIALNGDISTVDLLHLRGHFGIPRFSGDGFVPGPAAAARPPYRSPSAPSPAIEDQAPQQYPGGVGVGGEEAVPENAPEVEAAPPPPTPPGF